MNGKQKTDGIRLNKYLSSAGVCSRREADRLIESGRVRVDGVPAKQGAKVTAGQDVTVDGRPVRGGTERVVLAVYKPVGIICTEDPGTKNNIVRFLRYPVRVTYAGRLDKDSEGLLIMTNDGDLINRIMRGRNRHEKEYKVTVDREVTDAFVRKMSAGVRIRDEEKGLDAVTRPCRVWREGKYTFRIVLTQGLNRQIRRMCEACGCHVRTLKRTRIMNIELGDLRPGAYRKVEGRELEQLEALASAPGADRAGVSQKKQDRRKEHGDKAGNSGK